MRGVVVYIVLIMTILLSLFVAVSVIEPVGEHVKGYDEIDEGPLDGTSVINTTYTVLFKWMPLIVLGGMLIWAVRWYLREERFVGGGRRR